MATDTAAAGQFSSDLFGWQIQDALPEAGGYLRCMLKGRAAAAVSPIPLDSSLPTVWSTHLAFDDLMVRAAKAKNAGSPLTMEPTDVKTAGLLAFAIDPRWAPFSSWQAGRHIGVGIDNEPGAQGMTTAKEVPASGVACFCVEDAGAPAATAVRRQRPASTFRHPVRPNVLPDRHPGEAFSLIQAASEE
jgi:predicted enzyme related to lactoylglutathione lyase